MFRNHWLHRLSQRWFLRGTERSHRARRVLAMKRRDVKLMLEMLEDRLVLSTTITDLGILPGYTSSMATGINSTGEVVGFSMKSSGAEHAFLYSNGQLTDLGPIFFAQGTDQDLGINNSGQVVGGNSLSTGGQAAFQYSNGKATDLPLDSAVDINDNGQIAGNARPSSSLSRADQAALYSNGTVTYLGSFSKVTQFSVATAINASGQVIGFSDSSTFDNGGPNTENAFLYSNGKMTDLGTLPGDSNSIALDINAAGQVVGESSQSQYGGALAGTHAFLYSNGQMSDLGTLPGDTWSIAYGINSSEQVVGESGVVNSNGSISAHAFLHSNGQTIDLNSLLPANSGWQLTNATAINDAGEIVGDGFINGQEHAFLLNLDLNVSLSPASLPTGAVNSSYTQAITASGGIGDITLSYKVTSGTIPNGLTFTPKPNELDISGTPTAAGTVTFTVTATDSATPPHSITQTYTLTINNAAAPVITGNPNSQTVLAGSNVSFTASASGSPTPTVQWQVSRDKGATWTDVSGATSTTLTLNNVSFTLNGDQYRAAFTNSVGSGTSTPATLTVQTMPTITSGSNAAFTVGQGGSFIVTATGSPRPTMTEAGALPSGVTFTNTGNGTATLHGIPAPGTSGTYHFTISAHSSAGSVTQNFTLKVNSPPTPVFIVPPLLAFFDSLLGGTETVNADGTVTVTTSFFGFPLLVSTFDSHGDLESIYLFGINVTALFELL